MTCETQVPKIPWLSYNWIKQTKEIDMLLGKYLLIKFMYNFFSTKTKERKQNVYKGYE